MDLYKNKYRIKSTRLEGWDYSADGYYFVTICTKNRECFFGDVVDGKISLTEMGENANRYWNEMPDHFENVILDEFVVMPNHIHGIVIIENNRRDAINGVSTTATDGVSTKINDIPVVNGGITGSFNPMTTVNSLSKIVRWYKGRCRYEINRSQNKAFFSWQPRFYDHVIRDENSLNKIRAYILNNTLKWDIDENNPNNILNEKKIVT